MEIIKHGEKCSNEKRRKPRVKLKTMVTGSVTISAGWRFSQSLPSSSCKPIWEASLVCGTDEDAANVVSDLQWCWQLSEVVTAAETAMVGQMPFLKARCDRGRGPMLEADAAVAAQVTPLPAMKDGVSGARFGAVNEVVTESETAFDKRIVMCAAECERKATGTEACASKFESVTSAVAGVAALMESKIREGEVVVLRFSDTPEIFLNLSKCKYITKFFKKLGIAIKLRLERKNAKEGQRSEGSVNEQANC